MPELYRARSVSLPLRAWHGDALQQMGEKGAGAELDGDLPGSRACAGPGSAIDLRDV